MTHHHGGLLSVDPSGDEGADLFDGDPGPDDRPGVRAAKMVA